MLAANVVPTDCRECCHCSETLFIWQLIGNTEASVHWFYTGSDLTTYLRIVLSFDWLTVWTFSSWCVRATLIGFDWKSPQIHFNLITAAANNTGTHALTHTHIIEHPVGWWVCRGRCWTLRPGCGWAEGCGLLVISSQLVHYCGADLEHLSSQLNPRIFSL